MPDEQMCGGRNGDEFGQSLDDAEEEGLEEGHGGWRMVNGSWRMGQACAELSGMDGLESGAGGGEKSALVLGRNRIYKTLILMAILKIKNRIVCKFVMGYFADRKVKLASDPTPYKITRHSE